MSPLEGRQGTQYRFTATEATSAVSCHNGRVIGQSTDVELEPVPHGRRQIFLETPNGKIEQPPDVAEEWMLPGTGDAYPNCGKENGFLLCPHCNKFRGNTHNHCDRAVCPTCWNDWARRQVRRAIERLSEWPMVSKFPPRHITISLPPEERDLSPKEALKRFAAARKLLFLGRERAGGAQVLHVWRFQHPGTGESIEWGKTSFNTKARGTVVYGLALYSPHIHLLAIGRLMNATEFAERTGLVYKNISDLPDESALESALYYILSHSAIAGKRQKLTYFGRFSYNKQKLGMRETRKIPISCSECWEQLERFSLPDKSPKGLAYAKATVTCYWFVREGWPNQGKPSKEWFRTALEKKFRALGWYDDSAGQDIPKLKKYLK